MYYLKSELRIGDELRQAAPPVTHVMVYVGPIGPFGEDVLNAPKSGAAQLMHLADLTKDGPITIGARGPVSFAEQLAVQQRARQVLGTPNRLFSSNCEQISHFVRIGKAESPQLVAAFGLLAIAALGYAVVKA